jgi:D-glycero-D-manno-heptose 1,7-bisphosphate phosphatase
MKRPAVFIDRDGTINEEMGYVNHPSRFILLPGTAEAIRILNKTGFLAIVITNQSGAARGYFPRDLVEEIHNIMIRLLKDHGALVDAVFTCPHYPNGVVSEFSIDCPCRKPKTGLIDQARKQFDIDMLKSFVIGDRFSDIQLAHATVTRGILVKTGYGKGNLAHVIPQQPIQPDHVADNLLQAVQWITAEEVELS